MATVTRKRKTSSKSRTPSRRRRSTTSKKITASGMIQDLKQPTMIVLGLAAGKVIFDLTGKALDAIGKKATNSEEPPVSGLSGTALTWAKPLSVVLIGLLLPRFVPMGGQAKNIGLGISAYGGASLLNTVLGKNMFNLGRLKGMGLLAPYREIVAGGRRQVYRDPKLFDYPRIQHGIRPNATALEGRAGSL